MQGISSENITTCLDHFSRSSTFSTHLSLDGLDVLELWTMDSRNDRTHTSVKSCYDAFVYICRGTDLQSKLVINHVLHGCKKVQTTFFWSLKIRIVVIACIALSQILFDYLFTIFNPNLAISL